MRDFISAKGSVLISVWNAKTGKLIESSEEDNLVVDLGKENVAKLIGGDNVGKSITKVGVGEGNASPNKSDTSLTNVFMKNIDTVLYPSPKSVQFTFTLGSGDANGMEITELGLFNDNGGLFSRKTRSTISKNSSVIITGIWTITIN